MATAAGADEKPKRSEGMKLPAEIAESIGGVLEKEPAKSGEWLRIDRPYAETLVAKYTSGVSGSSE